MSRLRIRNLKIMGVMNSKSRVSTCLQVIGSLLIFLFVYTAVTKLAGFAHFQAVLSHSPLIGKSAPVLYKWPKVILKKI
jgi:hypothetical protein